MQVGGIYEQRDAQSVTYILEDSNLFFSTGYKVLKSQEGKGFVRCNHLTHNGKDKLVYDISKYKSLVSLATMFDSVALLDVFINLLDSLINAMNNGFMQYDNIDLAFENIYVDCNNYKVYLIYIPINMGMNNNDVPYFVDRFRYAANNFLENYFDNPDDNILYINSVITNMQYSFEDMKYMLFEKVKNYNNYDEYNNSMGESNFKQGNEHHNNISNSNVEMPIGNLGGMSGIKEKRYNNNPMKGNGGDVRETIDISDLFKQIKKSGYYDEIGENTCFEESEGFEQRHHNNNRLNLGGTPGSLSKANALGMNNLSNSGVIPNIKKDLRKSNSNSYRDRNNNSDKSRDRGKYRDRGNSRDRFSDKNYDNRDGYDDYSKSYGGSSRASANNSRNASPLRNNVNRTINATIRLVSDAESGEIELIIDKEEFLIGKNFNVVDGFIPYNEGISRVHCKIVYSRGEYSIVDMGSLNGTYVNGARIPVKSQVPISVGDTIGIANIQFTVETV